MDFGLAGRRALVVAGTAGLGWGIADCLANEGAQVVITGRDQHRIDRVVADRPGMYGIVHDLREEPVSRLTDAVNEIVGELDIVVLNGPGPQPSSAQELDREAVCTAMNTLVAPHIELVRTVLPGMRQRRWGRVVAVGSSSVVEPIPGLALSNLGRAALLGYLKTLSREVAVDGVTVNMVLPGRMDTDRVAQLDRHRAGNTGRSVEDVRAQSEREIPIGRYGTPHEFGAVATFLCSEQASYITGSAVRCDGGVISSL